MISPNNLLKIFLDNDINFFTGVPDSVLKNLTTLFNDSEKNHVVAVNEGSAVAIAIGSYLRTGKIPLIYMQNSGLGNAINPLVSIADKNVYDIPLIMLIGWRGAPDIDDESQHHKMGEITLNLLNLLGINYVILNKASDLNKLKKKLIFIKKNKKSLAILIKNKILSKPSNIHTKENINPIISRCKSLELILPIIKKYFIFSTTGYTSREILKISEKHKIDLRCFYNVGGMGHVSSLNLGFINSLNSKVKSICIDGDGALLMHLGSMHTAGSIKNINFKHLLFNNFSHLSVGAQKTYSENININLLVKSLGYRNYYKINNYKSLKKIFPKFLLGSGPSLLEIQCNNEVIDNLPRIKNFKKVYNEFIKK
jgi:phosphonopyruvate decarboxylase